MTPHRSNAHPTPTEHKLQTPTAMTPIFIHSSFRTASTWLWEKFRAQQGYLAFYEIFNEALADLNLKSVRASGEDWDSHHPKSSPYFLEFVALLDGEGGVGGYDRSMAYQSFFPANGTNGNISTIERSYVERLIRLAQASFQIPVLTCTRSLARIAGLRGEFGGIHIVVIRNLWHQWLSYSNQFSNGNPFFINTIVDIVFSSSSEPAMEIVKRFMCDNNISSKTNLAPNDDLFIAFVVLHVYILSVAYKDVDLVIRVNELSRSVDYRERIESDIRAKCGVKLDLRDAVEAIALPQGMIENRQRVQHTIEVLWDVMRSDGQVDVHADEIANRLFAELWTEVDVHTRYVEPVFRRMQGAELAAAVARQRVDALESDHLKLSSEQAGWRNSEVLLNSRIAALEGHVVFLNTEKIGLAQEITGIGSLRDNLIIQLQEGVRERQALESRLALLVENATALAAERDAVIQEAVRLRSELEAAEANRSGLDTQIHAAEARIVDLTQESCALVEALSLAQSDLTTNALERERLMLECDALRLDRNRQREISETAQRQFARWQEQSIWKKIWFKT